MKIHRRPEYLFGKRTVNQASVLRRAVARGIDMLLTVFPPVFWTSVVADSHAQIEQQSVSMGIKNLVLIVSLSIISMWIAGILVLSVMEGIWGMTPGKWLCGIRTLRTTLRPCGVLRAFARELMVYVDSVFLMVWLPGVLLIAFTPHWQRLGDLTADTVVVLDPHQHFSGAGGVGNQAYTLDDAAGALAHQAVVAGEIGLTFAAVDDERGEREAAEEAPPGREGGKDDLGDQPVLPAGEQGHDLS